MTKDSGRLGFADRATDAPHEAPAGLRPDGSVSTDAGALRVWWVPQVPMKAFEVDVPDLFTAARILDVLADYDAFQFRTNVKGDYCNVGGLMILRDDGEWEDWEDPDTFDDFDHWRDEHAPRLRTNGWREFNPAQGIEARQRQDREDGLGPEDESPVGNADAPEGSQS